MKVLKRKKNGNRKEVYFLGIKIFSYKSRHKNDTANTFPKTLSDAIILKDGCSEYSLNILRDYLFTRSAKHYEHDHGIWLCVITGLIQSNQRAIAQSLLVEYFEKFGLCGRIQYFQEVCQLAYDMNYRNNEIDQAYETYSKIKTIHDQNRFEKLVKSAKKIAVVGRSPILLNKNLGVEIDSHDLVIRFNNSDVSGKFKNDYGTKIDVNFINFHEEGKQKDKNVLHIFMEYKTYNIPLQTLNNIMNCINENIDMLGYGVRYWICMQSGLFAPTGGAIAILWIKKILGTLENVNIYGFSFQDEDRSMAHFDADHLSDTKFHNMEAEIIFLKNLVKGEQNND